MNHYVRPQIYATTPIKEVKQQLSRGVMPAPFVRRMRVINIISAITLRKIESSSILPFDVQDLHHILDKQISQDAIISIMNDQPLKTALYDGNLQPLWESAKTMPLLRKGFDQSWIARFILTPFDPICMMLAMRAKLLLDAIDELGHSYNLLRTLGMGWIDFGEIPGEEPDDPGSYVPPGIDQPIDYPDTIPLPGPGDPGYIPGPEDPGYIPPTSLAPGDPGYTTTIDSPGYIPPNGGTPGASGIPSSPLPPITLGTGPGSPLSGGGPGSSRPAWGFNCCISVEDPESFVEIGYFTDHIDPGESLGLTVKNAHESCAGEKYTWAITSGGGELSTETGLDVIFTAPATGHGCPGNTIISLYCGGEVIDTLNITINYDYSIEFSYGDPELEIDREDSLVVAVIANNTPLIWSVEGTGFSLEHEETDGVGNVLHADETACGSAIITVIGCNEASVVGSVRCTSGQWVQKSTVCDFPGAANVEVVAGALYATRIEGNKKQQGAWTWETTYGYKVYGPGTECEDVYAEFCLGGGTGCLEFTTPCAELSAGQPDPCAQSENYVYCSGGCTCAWSIDDPKRYCDLTVAAYGLRWYKYYEWEC